MSRAVLIMTTIAMLHGTASHAGQYADVNGLHLYYETYGTPSAKPPLVLLHGGGSMIESSFAKLIPQLPKDRLIVAFDQQGYGRTADIADRPFTFTQSADDTAALLRHLHIARADLLGYSNGGTIALQVAIRHPQLVSRLVLMSSNFRRDGMEPALYEGFRHASLETMPASLKADYLRVAPHPEQLQQMHDKSVQRMLQFEDIPAKALQAIAVPVLVMAGDRDVVTLEHVIAMYRLFPHGRLAIVPNADHMQMVEWSPAQVELVTTFLAD